MTHAPEPRATDAAWYGEQLLESLAFATRWLDHHRDRVNALNVFPIPDGDTGTNMSLTMNGSLEAARSTEEPHSAGAVADRFAFGALMGARGNSGVILSQIFRGFASSLSGNEVMDGERLAAALKGAKDKAYKAVMRPVEGTMLTVIRVAAERAAEKVDAGSSVADVLGYALEGAEEALAKTPEMLDILRQAGVVDSGGQGVVHILDGMRKYALGDTTIADDESMGAIGAEMKFLDDVAELHGEDAFGYCTNFMIFGDNMDFETAREKIASMGQSVVAVGDETMIKVHIHAENPGEVLSYALSLGYLDQIKIDNMTLQTETLTEQLHSAKAGETHPAPEAADHTRPVEVDGDIGVIAVAAGSGLANALSSMGADIIVHGGQTMNPSTEELLSAVEQISCDQVIILPNNKNIVMAAQQVADLTDKKVAVIPSKSLPQGLGALAAFNRAEPLETNVEVMTGVLPAIGSIEITTAVRDVEIEGVKVVAGQLLGLANGKIVASGTDLSEIVVQTLGTMHELEPELITVFLGEDAEESATEALVAEAERVFPDAEIEVIDGNQPHYQYLIAVE